MKIRLRSQLVLALVLCMGLVMTTGIASAAITTTDGVAVSFGNTLSSGTEVRSTATGSGGFQIIYYESDGKTQLTLPNSEVTHDGTVWSATVADTPTPSIEGYHDNKWEVLGTTSYEKEGSTYDTLALKRVPIIYTIEYYDGETLLETQKLTVESLGLFYDGGGITKDGYTFACWTTYQGNDIITPGHSITDTFLKAAGKDSNGYTIKLYALWKENPTSTDTNEAPPKPEVPLDDSPRTGNDVPVGIAFLLMVAAATSSSILLQRRKKSEN